MHKYLIILIAILMMVGAFATYQTKKTAEPIIYMDERFPNF